ncbi:EamA domain-containing membrane protein RarD [Lutibacter agarilyticus]|uniref:EamA domain-containing membrane protein RarD n=1 Tax=Lutibacter agarilyticus TaxID=1109740 RepID=A0A238VT75_9FLAO|nr:DMT family transporter [Lutibacter agarilyticus]SNR37354.1 EamA domain-containing membrane protein RarD [Lutibacter agarilyticus]
MDHKQLRWVYLFLLSLIWGSSFILMKYALVGLTAMQVGALRVIITAVFMLLIGFKRLFKIKKRHWYYLALNGLIGSFIPAFLMAYTVEKMDSSVVSILNSLTPLNTLIFGALVFGFGFRKRQLIGVLIGLVGTVLLVLKGAELNPNQDYAYSVFILVASICYALNINILKKYLYDLDALSITVANFAISVIPALVLLGFTDFYSTFELNDSSLKGLFYLSILAVVGTGLAKLMFNRLIQISSAIFSSSVTYIIPIVAITWGILDGETITFVQFIAAFIILLGVYIVNKAK